MKLRAMPAGYFLITLAGLTLATAGFAANHKHGPDGAHHRANTRYAEGRWVAQVRYDSFTGAVRCTLAGKKGDLAYLPGAVGFNFGKRINTLRAWYRVDNGAARRWQDDYPLLAAMHLPIDGPGLDNPTGGIVWIPAASLAGAKQVTIRPAADKRPRLFHIDGLDPLLASVRAQGCFADTARAPK